MLTKVQTKAICNLSDSVDLAVEIPHRVLAADYHEIFVMDYQRLLREDTVDLLKVLLKFEGSTTGVIAHFAEIGRETPDWQDDVFFVTPSTEAGAYWSFVRRNIVEYGQKSAPRDMRVPWWICAEKLGACSDLGSWCIYGQRHAEIAILGFKQRPGELLEKKLYIDFRIERLANALKRDTFFGDPGNDYSKRQRLILQASYLE